MNLVLIAVAAALFLPTVFLNAHGLSIVSNNDINCDNGKCTHTETYHCKGCSDLGSKSDPQYKAGYDKLISDWKAVCPDGKNDTKYCNGYSDAMADLSGIK